MKCCNQQTVLLILHAALVQHAAAFPPRFLQAVPTLQIEGGASLSYQISNTTFQSNKAGGFLNYSLTSANQQPLPPWLQWNSSSLTLQGVPPTDQDYTLNLALAAADRDGKTSTTPVLLLTAIPCPSNTYRHFRVKITGFTAAFWGLSSGTPPEAAICTLSWESTAASAFPTVPGASLNFTSYSSGANAGLSIGSAGPQGAFNQLGSGRCDIYVSQSWVVSARSSHFGKQQCTNTTLLVHCSVTGLCTSLPHADL